MQRFIRVAAPALRTSGIQKRTMAVHNVAVAGFGEGTNELYDRARPSYPPAALQFLRSQLPQQPLRIIEAGSGTGIFSRLLLSPPTPEYPRFDVEALAAVEPSAGMRAEFEKGLSKVPREDLEGKNVRTVEGGFDDFSQAGIGKEEADAVIIAQAFHWCPDYEKAMREIAAYLKPGAPLVLVWNLEQNQDEWHQSLRDLYQPFDLGSPQYYRGLWKALYDTEAYATLFDPVQPEQFPWSVGMTEDAIRDRIFSKSYLTEGNLKGQAREDLDAELRRRIHADTPGKEYLDKERGVVNYKYNTDLLVIRRKE